MAAPYFREDGPWGAGTGAKLTKAQFDANTYNFDTRITAVEAAIPDTLITIDYLELVDPDQLYFHMTDHSILGPITIPTASFHLRDDGWLPDTFYSKNDVFNYNGVIYLVDHDHTSNSGSFDPGANDGPDEDRYIALLTQPAAVLPAGGTTRQALIKKSDADFDFEFLDLHMIPDHGSAGQYIKKSSSTEFDVEWADVVRTLDRHVDSLDMANAQTQYFVAPVDGFIEGFDVIVQETVATGGLIVVHIAGVAIGLVCTVADSASPGTKYSHEGSADGVFSKGDAISLTLTGFGGSPAGALGVHIRYHDYTP